MEEESPEARSCWFIPETEKRSAWLKGLTRAITGMRSERYQMADVKGPMGHCKASALS